jgi:hypothetical protein
LRVGSSAISARTSRPGTKRRTRLGQGAALAWDEPGWLDEATAWIDERVERTGDVDVVRTRPWSAIARVPTADGVLWFKENPLADEFEPALTELLLHRRPDALPEVAAAEGRRFLTRDVGPGLRNVLNAGEPAPSWEEILTLYAELQIEFIGVVDEALRVGTPDDRPELLAERYVELGGTREASTRGAASRLAGSLPLTVAHMEGHDGNIFLRDGRPVFIDWAEAVVTHPFVGPLQTLRGAVDRRGHEPGSPEVERLRDVYLEPFSQFAPMPELRRLFWDGYLLHGVSRAELWRRTLAPLSPEARREYGEPVAAWLTIIEELVDGVTTLGGA